VVVTELRRLDTDRLSLQYTFIYSEEAELPPTSLLLLKKQRALEDEPSAPQQARDGPNPTDESALAATDGRGAYVSDLSVEEEDADADAAAAVDAGGAPSSSPPSSPPPLPPQLLFVHCGSEQFAEVHWRPIISSLLMTTARSGTSAFVPSNLRRRRGGGRREGETGGKRATHSEALFQSAKGLFIFVRLSAYRTIIQLNTCRDLSHFQAPTPTGALD
jgi:hypothetical protein